MQINLGRGRKAHDMMEFLAIHLCTSVILLSQPNKQISRARGYILNEEKDAGIALLDNELRVNKILRGKGFVAVWTEKVLLISVYISPNVSEDVTETLLEHLTTVLTGWRGYVIIGGDFNAKAREWASDREDRRGRTILEWTSSEDLFVANNGNTPTFLREEQTSYIDLTLSKHRALQNLVGWRLRDDVFSSSLHRYITFSLTIPDPPPRSSTLIQRGGWIIYERNGEDFRNQLRNKCEHLDVQNAQK